MSAKASRSLGYVFVILAFLCALLIWRFSLEDGTLSSSRSSAILLLIQRVFTFIAPMWGELLLRKAAHLLEYAVLGGILTTAVLCFKKPLRTYFPHVLLPCLLCAVIDETIQIYTPGRTSSTKDVLIDFAGALAGMFFMCALSFITKRIWPKRKRH